MQTPEPSRDYIIPGKATITLKLHRCGGNGESAAVITYGMGVMGGCAKICRVRLKS
jgi:hypothetical protein